MSALGTTGLPPRSFPLIDAARLIQAPWYSTLVNLVQGAASLGPSASSATISGWGTSAGGARGAVNGAFAQTAAAGYSQSDTQNLINQVEALSKALAQALNDLETFKVLGS